MEEFGVEAPADAFFVGEQGFQQGQADRRRRLAGVHAGIEAQDSVTRRRRRVIEDIRYREALGFGVELETGGSGLVLV